MNIKFSFFFQIAIYHNVHCKKEPSKKRDGYTESEEIAGTKVTGRPISPSALKAFAKPEISISKSNLSICKRNLSLWFIRVNAANLLI